MVELGTHGLRELLRCRVAREGLASRRACPRYVEAVVERASGVVDGVELVSRVSRERRQTIGDAIEVAMAVANRLDQSVA